MAKKRKALENFKSDKLASKDLKVQSFVTTNKTQDQYIKGGHFETETGHFCHSACTMGGPCCDK